MSTSVWYVIMTQYMLLLFPDMFTLHEGIMFSLQTAVSVCVSLYLFIFLCACITCLSLFLHIYLTSSQILTSHPFSFFKLLSLCLCLYLCLLIPSLTPSLILSLHLSPHSSLFPFSAQRFTLALFLYLFRHIRLLIVTDLRSPTKNLEVTLVVLRGCRWFGSPHQVA